jgi:iron complex transport system substrate-binding protein
MDHRVSRRERSENGENAVEINKISGQVVYAALRIHRLLGPGLFESVYEAILARDLEQAGFDVKRQKGFPLTFEGMVFEEAFRADLIIEDKVIVEVKSMPAIAAVHEKQLWSYMKLLDLRVGLLLNFGGALMKDGIKRLVNHL